MSRTHGNRRRHKKNRYPTIRPASIRASNSCCSKSTPAGWLGTRKPLLCPQACSRAPKRGLPDEARRSNEASVSINRRRFAASRLPLGHTRRLSIQAGSARGLSGYPRPAGRRGGIGLRVESESARACRERDRRPPPCPRAVGSGPRSGLCAKQRKPALVWQVCRSFYI
jgi:hypothetical protein